MMARRHLTRSHGHEGLIVRVAVELDRRASPACRPSCLVEAGTAFGPSSTSPEVWTSPPMCCSMAVEFRSLLSAA